MNDGIDTVLGDGRGSQRLVAGLAHHQRNAFRHCPVEAGREIVEYHDGFAGIEQRVNHVAADIAGATGDQDRHSLGSR